MGWVQIALVFYKVEGEDAHGEDDGEQQRSDLAAGQEVARHDESHQKRENDSDAPKVEDGPNGDNEATGLERCCLVPYEAHKAGAGPDLV